MALVYARPEDRKPGITALTEAALPWAAPWYVAGDLNVQLGAPRSAKEGRLVGAATRWARDVGLSCVTVGGPTCVQDRGRDRAAELDYFFVPRAAAGAAHVAAAWRHQLSDHAWLSLRAGMSPAPCGRPCTPAATRGLSQAAVADLRRRFAALAALFGVRDADGAGAGGEVGWNQALADGGAVYLR